MRQFLILFFSLFLSLINNAQAAELKKSDSDSGALVKFNELRLCAVLYDESVTRVFSTEEKAKLNVCLKQFSEVLLKNGNSLAHQPPPFDLNKNMIMRNDGMVDG